MNGFLYIDKPSGLTSRDVVNQLCKIYGVRKVGHTGTLDPLATGVLVVAFGRGTKLIEEVTATQKVYQATVQLGKMTDTLDCTGNVIQESSFVTPSRSELEKVLASFQGPSFQEVPLYSAVRVEGRRLYDYARKKNSVTLPKRVIHIYEIHLLEVTKDTFSFQVRVSKGTYIRSLIRDIGTMLGIPCTMSSLVRMKQGNIALSDCVSLSDVTKATPLHSFDEVLAMYPSYTVSKADEKRVINGAKITNPSYTDKVRIYNMDHQLLALYQVDEHNTAYLKVAVLLKVD